MTALLIVLGWIVAYLAVGAVYARSQAVACMKNATAKVMAEDWHTTKSIRDRRTSESYRMGLHLRFWLWPGALLLAPVLAFIAAPVESRRDQAEQFRADAETWREKQRTGTPEERAMADELARMCEERAREVDL